jgi:hypothetical protein
VHGGEALRALTRLFCLHGHIRERNRTRLPGHRQPRPGRRQQRLHYHGLAARVAQPPCTTLPDASVAVTFVSAIS